jgi:hypothetical protein
MFKYGSTFGSTTTSKFGIQNPKKWSKFNIHKGSKQKPKHQFSTSKTKQSNIPQYTSETKQSNIPQYTSKTKPKSKQQFSTSKTKPKPKQQFSTSETKQSNIPQYTTLNIPNVKKYVESTIGGFGSKQINNNPFKSMFGHKKNIEDEVERLKGKKIKPRKQKKTFSKSVVQHLTEETILNVLSQYPESGHYKLQLVQDLNEITGIENNYVRVNQLLNPYKYILFGGNAPWASPVISLNHGYYILRQYVRNIEQIKSLKILYDKIKNNVMSSSFKYEYDNRFEKSMLHNLLLPYIFAGAFLILSDDHLMTGSMNRKKAVELLNKYFKFDVVFNMKKIQEFTDIYQNAGMKSVEIQGIPVEIHRLYNAHIKQIIKDNPQKMCYDAVKKIYESAYLEYIWRNPKNPNYHPKNRRFMWDLFSIGNTSIWVHKITSDQIKKSIKFIRIRFKNNNDRLNLQVIYKYYDSCHQDTLNKIKKIVDDRLQNKSQYYTYAQYRSDTYKINKLTHKIFKYRDKLVNIKNEYGDGKYLLKYNTLIETIFNHIKSLSNLLK